MEQSLIWQNGIWLVEYNSNTWKIASPPECYRNVKSWPMNYRHNSFKKVRSAVLPHTHSLTLGGFGVVWKFYFSSIWDDSRVTALWLNWTFKIMGNSCSSCGGKITETVELNQEYFQRLDFVFQLYVDQYYRTFLSRKSIFKLVSFWEPLGQFELRLKQVCSFHFFFARQNLVLVFLNLQRKLCTRGC